MYKVTYKKSNGEVFERIRNTLPDCSIGESTSMGWIILDIQWLFNDNYYSFRDYCYLTRKEEKRYLVYSKIKKHIKQALLPMLIVFMIPTYEFIKFII